MPERLPKPFYVFRLYKNRFLSLGDSDASGIEYVEDWRKALSWQTQGSALRWLTRWGSVVLPTTVESLELVRITPTHTFTIETL